MSIFSKIFQGSVGELVEKVGGVVDKFVTTGEDKHNFKVELEQLAHQFMLDKEKLANDRLATYLADKQDARAMQEAAATSSDPVVRRFIYYFSWFWSVVAATYIGAISFLPIPDSNMSNVNFVTGFLLGSIIMTIIAFFFGASDERNSKGAS